MPSIWKRLLREILGGNPLVIAGIAHIARVAGKSDVTRVLTTGIPLRSRHEAFYPSPGNEKEGSSCSYLGVWARRVKEVEKKAG
jgi:hypothetical protein